MAGLRSRSIQTAASTTDQTAPKISEGFDTRKKIFKGERHVEKSAL
jgi:hypothetical protein